VLTLNHAAGTEVLQELVNFRSDPATISSGRPLIGLERASHERWEEELTLDEQRTHHDPRRATKPANLLSETPKGVMQELYALSLGHFVTRLKINADRMGLLRRCLRPKR
jgi:hypothetical protein